MLSLLYLACVWFLLALHSGVAHVAAAAPLLPAIGVCLSGLEWGSAFPGRINQDWFPPLASEYIYFHSQNLNLIRLPFAWERMQPVLGGELDPSYLAIVVSQVNIAASLNMTVLLDCHNYARFKGTLINSTGTVLHSHFADLWRRLATVFAGNKGVHGYDIMNEPNSYPNNDLTTWPVSAQAAIDAIRSVDKNTPIHLEGNQWSGANNWTLLNPLFPLQDPSNKIVYSAHLYLDRDGSGTHSDWNEEARYGITVQTGVQRIQSFASWLKQHNQKGHIGELGIGDNSENWFIAMDNTVAVMAENDMQFTYWSGGARWATYIYGVDVVSVNGRQQPRRQMSVLNKWASSVQFKESWLTGPARGVVNQASGNFTLDVRGQIIGALSYSCYDGVSATAFKTIAIQTQFTALVNFTFTPSAAGAYEIYCLASDPTYTNAPAVAFTASAAVEAF